MIGNEIQLTRRIEFYGSSGDLQQSFAEFNRELLKISQNELDQQLTDWPVIGSWLEVEKYELNDPGNNLKKRLQDAVKLALKPVLMKGNQFIPGMYDKFRQHNFSFKDYDVEILEYVKGRHSLRLAINFHSVECYLLDHFGTELLIALSDQPSTISRTGRKQLSTVLVYLGERTSICKFVPFERNLTNQPK